MPAAAGAPDRVAEVKEAFAALARSLKRISIYRHASDQHATFLEPALQSIRQLLGREGAVTVEVEPTALLFEREQVYSEPAREWSLCFRMHRDGIRSITFKSALNLAELLTFVSVALPDPQGGVGPGREDAVTELWKADLDAIGYTAVSGYRMDQTAEDKEKVLDAVTEVAERAQGTLDRFAAELGFADEEKAKSHPALWAEDRRKADDPESWAELARHATLTILQIVEKNFAGKDLESLQEAFGRLLDEMVDRKEPTALSAALERLRDLGGAHAEPVRLSLGRRLAESWRVARMVELCSKSSDAHSFALPVYLGILPPEAGPSLLDGVEMESTTVVRSELARAAAARIESCRDRFEERIRKGTPEVARALLSALEITPPGLRSAVAVQALSHRSLPVQLDAVTLIGADGANAVKHLGPLLTHADPSLRTAAASVLGGAAGAPEESATLLLAVMGGQEFAAAERAEQTVFCRALGRLGTSQGFAYLTERLQNPKKSFFNKKGSEETQLLAVQGLAAEASARSLKVLEHAGLPATGNPPAVAAASRAAANHVRTALAKGSKA